MQIIYEPIWERCTKEEYDKNYSTFEKMLTSEHTYKREGIYKNQKPGIMWQIENFDTKPDYYKYYKQTGTKKVYLVTQWEYDAFGKLIEEYEQ